MLDTQHWRTNGGVVVPGPSFLHDQEIVFSSRRARYEKPENTSWVLPTQNVARVIADSFKTIPQVKSVCYLTGTDGFTVWTLLGKRDSKAREKVYQKELEVCERLNLHDFQFRVTSVDLVSPSELKGTGFVEIFAR